MTFGQLVKLNIVMRLFPLLVLTTATSLAAEDQLSKAREVRQIQATDLESSIQVVGRLGYLLGSAIRITGEIVHPDRSTMPHLGPIKARDKVIRVTEVGGKAFRQQVFLRVSLNSESTIPGAGNLRHAQPGEIVTIVGYESGGFIGLTNEEQPGGGASPATPYGFYTFFRVPYRLDQIHGEPKTEKTDAEQDGARQPATRPESKSE